MRTILSIIAAMAIGLAGQASAQTPVDPAAEARIRADVAALADDAMEGRGTGQPGYERAARYVEARYGEAGLTPIGADHSWRKPFVVGRLGTADAGATLTWTPPGGRAQVWRNGEHALFGMGRAAGRVDQTAEMVFVGYGLVAPELGMDDYAGLDVTGKVVVFLSGAPLGTDPVLAERLEAAKSRNAEARGAVGSVTVNTAASAQRYTEALMRRAAGRTETAWVGPDGLARRAAPGIAVTAFLSDPTAERLFQGQARSYADIRREAAQPGGRPAGFALNGQAAFTVHTRRQDIPAFNVVGVIPGSDPALAGEYVVMTAHLDHLGVSSSGRDRINNGAMDNATGVAAMLEAARLLAADPPRRSVLVVALDAEEWGLIGSDYLARFPLGEGQVVANVNLDMPVLTYAFTDVVAFGAEHSTLGPLVADAAQTEGVRLSPDPMPEQNVFVRSDHYSFVQAGVPAVMLATGYADGGEAAWGDFFTNRYHKPGDELSDAFDWNAAARFARLNAAIVRAVADADARPLWYQGNPYGDRFAPDAPRAPAPVN